MIVVSDATPIRYLVLIGAIDFLPTLYGRVLLPRAVYNELTRPRTPETVRRWIEMPPGWIEIRDVGPVQEWDVLGPGEQEAIALALSLKADLVLIDERRGRVLAEAEGLSVTGTLGILEKASQQNLLILVEAIEKLKQTNFYIDERVIQDLLARLTTTEPGDDLDPCG